MKQAARARRDSLDPQATRTRGRCAPVICLALLLIAATALGYGSCWLEGRTAAHEEAFKTLLGVPQDRRLITLVAFGLPVEWPTKEKRPLEQVLHWEKY